LPGSSAAVLALVLTLAGCSFAPVGTQSLQGTGRIYFVAVGEFPRTLQDALSEQYKRKYNLDIQTLSSINLDMSSFDARRNQLVAEEAIRLMKAGNPDLANDSQSILIGLTAQDMYIKNKPWQFAFSYREGDRFAVVSSGRMNLGLLPAQSNEFQARVRKMVTKNIGILYFHLPMNSDPRSVLYGNVGGIEELDAMGEEF
jgi:predicted Zn-dependent protease